MPDVSPETLQLRQALEAAQRDGAAAASRAQQAESRLRSETGTRFAIQEAALKTEAQQIETQATALQDKVANLLAEGNFAEAAALNRQLAAGEAKLIDLRRQQEWFEGQKAQASAPASDPLASYNATERAWIEKNPRFLSDPDFAERVKGAAGRAMYRHAKDSADYFKAIEADIYPDRAIPDPAPPAAPAQETQADPDDGGEDEMTLPNAPPISDVPLSDPEEHQPRAVGRGGDGIRSVAAPPSRRIVEASSRNLRQGQRLEPTYEELQIARQLYNDLEPAAEDRSDIAAVRWYHAMYNHPSHRNTRRREWVNN